MVVHIRTPIWRCVIYILVLLHIILRVEAQNNEGQQTLGKENEATAVFEKTVQEEDLLKKKDADVKVGAVPKKDEANLGFTHAFVASISVIIVSEIGDKTFFIAAILAMKHSRLTVFAGAISALGLMTFLSVCLGFATMIIPRAVTFFVCTALLAVFGVKMLYDGWKMSPDEGKGEFEEVSAELQKTEGTQSGVQRMPEGRRGCSQCSSEETSVVPWSSDLTHLHPSIHPHLPG
eukprot:Em0022g246a